MLPSVAIGRDAVDLDRRAVDASELERDGGIQTVFAVGDVSEQLVRLLAEAVDTQTEMMILNKSKSNRTWREDDIRTSPVLYV